MMDPEFQRRARELTWLLSDVDGVLTDGRMVYGAAGELLKVFHVRDGLALKLAQRAGLRVGLLSARGGPAVERRAEELGLDAALLQRGDKVAALNAFLTEQGATAEQVAYIGDDLQDLKVLALCGLAFCPADAVAEVQRQVDWVLQRRGGQGAVREAVELLLEARGQWPDIVAAYLPS